MYLITINNTSPVTYLAKHEHPLFPLPKTPVKQIARKFSTKKIVKDKIKTLEDKFRGCQFTYTKL
jgi:hypothetical protein